ncbi:MAG: hypothetical protein HQL13_02835 [Candidatus Omnitrophica bacterium]|nr:hypothetical protein [Candidatus Omnitrophota bacterium]
MSARFFKILSIVVMAHAVLLGMVWIGFTAPGPRPPAAFIYEGPLPLVDDKKPQEVSGGYKEGVQIPFFLDRGESSDLNHWVKLREASK